MVTPGKAPNGILVFTSTTYLPSAFTVAIGNREVPIWKLFDDMWKLYVYSTSSAVNSPKPFCHFTPSRILMRQVSGSGLVHSSAMFGMMERSLKLMVTSPSNTLYITRLPWMSERITGLRLPNSPPHVPTRRSRLPCAIAGADSKSPVPSAPAPKPRRVMPRPPVVRNPLLIAVSFGTRNLCRIPSGRFR